MLKKKLLTKCILAAIGVGLLGNSLAVLPTEAAWNSNKHTIYYVDGGEQYLANTQLYYDYVYNSFGVTTGAGVNPGSYPNKKAGNTYGGDIIDYIDGSLVNQTTLNNSVWQSSNIYDNTNGIEKGYISKSANPNFNGTLSYSQWDNFVAAVDSGSSTAGLTHEFFIKQGNSWVDIHGSGTTYGTSGIKYMMSISDYVKTKYTTATATERTALVNAITANYASHIYTFDGTDYVFVDFSNYDSTKGVSSLDIYTGIIRGNNWEYLMQNTNTSTGLDKQAYWGFRFVNEAASGSSSGSGSNGLITTKDLNSAMYQTFLNDTILYGRDITKGTVAAAETATTTTGTTTTLNNSTIDLYRPGTQKSDGTFANDEKAFSIELPNNVWYDNANQNSISFKNSSQKNAQNTVSDASSYAIGANTIYGGTNFAVGGITTANALGTEAANVTGAVVYGSGNTVTANNATAIGNGTTVDQINSVAIGNASATKAANTGDTAQKVTFGTTTTTFAGPASTANGVLSVGAANAERQIQNVAAGDITDKSTDAVNGSQLFATNQQVQTNITNIAGNTTNINKLTTKMGDTKNLNQDVKNTTDGDNTTIVNAINNLDNNAVKYDKKSDGTTNYDSVTLGNGAGTTYNKTTTGGKATYTGGTSLTNIKYASGTNGSEAVNVDYLTDKISSTTADLTAKEKHVQKGSYAVTSSNTVTMPIVNGNEAATGEKVVITGVANASDVGSITNIKKDGTGDTTGNSVVNNINNLYKSTSDLDKNAVKYDKNSDGTINYDSVTLGNGSGTAYAKSTTGGKTTYTGGTSLTNIKYASGTNGSEAVNVDYLTDQITKTTTDLTAKEKHVQKGSYAVTSSNTVTMPIVNGNEGVTGETVVITGVASSADLGSITNIKKDGTGDTTGNSVVSNINNLYKNTTANDKNAVKYDKNSDGTINYDSVTLGNGSGTAYTKSTTGGKTTYTGGTSLTNIKYASGTNGSEAVNVDYLTDQITKTTTSLTGTGLVFAGNTGSNTVKLGKTVTIAGSKADATKLYSSANLTTEETQDATTGNSTITIKMSTTPSFTKITAGTDSTKQVTISDDGVNVGGNTYITKDGINANNQKITNVASGDIKEGSTDAVNGGQIFNKIGDTTIINKDIKNYTTTTDPITGKTTTTYNTTNIVDALNNLDNNAVKYDKNADGSTNYNSVTMGNGNGTTYNATTKSGGTSVSNISYAITDKTNANYNGSAAVNTDLLNDKITEAKTAATNNDQHIKAGTYAVGNVAGEANKNSVSMDIVDGTGTKTGTATITDIAKASDMGSTSNINSQLKNTDGSATTVVDAINNLNTKVGDTTKINSDIMNKDAAGKTTTTSTVDAINNLDNKVDTKVGDNQYSKTDLTNGNTIKDGDSSTTAISKLENQITTNSTTVNKTIDAKSVTGGSVSTTEGDTINLTNKNGDVIAKVSGVTDERLINGSAAFTTAAGTTVKGYKADTNGTIAMTVQDKNDTTKTSTVNLVDVASKTQLDQLSNKVGDTNNLNDSVKNTVTTTNADGSTTTKTTTTTVVEAINNVAGNSVHYDVNNGTVNKNSITLGGGTAGTTLTNIAPGTVSSTSTDAVNGSQLYTVNANSILRDQELSSVVGTLDDRVNRVGAGAAALAGLHPLDYDAEYKWDFAASMGQYRGTRAAAMGAFYRPNEDVMFSFAASMGNGDSMWNAGVSFKLGPNGSGLPTARVDMAREIRDLQGVNKKLSTENKSLNDKLDSLSVKNKELNDKVEALYQQVQAMVKSQQAVPAK